MVRSCKEDVLDREERKKIMEECKTEKENVSVKIILFTGLRAGELQNLKKYWIDWSKDIINVPRQDGGWFPKTKAGARQIPLLFEAKQILYKFISSMVLN